MERPYLSKHNENHIRCDKAIIDVLTGALRDILRSEIPETDICQLVKVNSAVLRLNPEQKSCIKNVAHSGYSSFDISLLYTLIRNITQISPPSRGWGNKQKPGQFQTLGDVVERIRIVRNEFSGHAASTEISDTEFVVIWKKLLDICQKLDTVFKCELYTKQLKEIETMNIDRRDKSTVNVIDLGNVQALQRRYSSHKLESHEQEHLQKILLEFYEELTTSVPLSPLVQNMGLPTEQLCVAIDLKVDQRSKSHNPFVTGMDENLVIKTFKDLFSMNNSKVERIFLYADAGGGKTCYAFRMLSTWTNALKTKQSYNSQLTEDEEALVEFDFIFYMALRHVHSEYLSVLELICDEYFLGSHDHMVREFARRALINDSHSCLIILDGLDEWSQDQLPSLCGMMNSRIVFLTRPSKLAQLNLKYSSFDRIVKILPLNIEGVENIVKTIVGKFHGLEGTEHDEKVKEILEQLDKPHLEHIVGVPLFLTYLTEALYSGSQLSSFSTELYYEIIEMLILKAENDNRITSEMKLSLKTLTSTSDNRRRTKVEYHKALLKLGELAFQLELKNNCLVFSESELRSIFQNDWDTVIEFGLVTGLICTSIVPTFSKSRTSYNFFHKSILEFLAALYISENDVKAIYHSHIRSLDDLLNHLVTFKFISGLNPPQTGKLVDLSLHVVDQDKDFKCYRETMNSESRDKVKIIYNTICDMYHESKLGEGGYELRSSANTKHLDIFLDEESNDVTLQITKEIVIGSQYEVGSISLENEKLGDGDDLIHNEDLHVLLTRSNKLVALSLRRLHLEKFGLHLSKPNLNVLILRDITLSDKALESLLEYIQTCTSFLKLRLSAVYSSHPLNLCLPNASTIRSLTLQNLSLTSPSVTALQNFLHKSNSLTELRLEDITSIIERKMISLHLASKPKLTVLALHNLVISEPSEDSSIILDENKELEFLTLDDIKIGKRGVKNITICLRDKFSIKTLHLANMSISSETFSELSHNIRSYSSLENLGLENLKTPGVSEMLHLDLTQNTNLKTLYISGMDISLLLGPPLTEIEEIVLVELNLSPQIWETFLNSLLRVNCKVEVTCQNVNIDNKSIDILRSLPYFRIHSFQKSEKSGNYNIEFTTIVNVDFGNSTFSEVVQNAEILF